MQSTLQALLLLLSLLMGHRAIAQPHTLVLLAPPDSSPRQRRLLEETLRAQISDLNVTLVVRELPRQRGGWSLQRLIPRARAAAIESGAIAVLALPEPSSEGTASRPTSKPTTRPAKQSWSPSSLLIAQRSTFLLRAIEGRGEEFEALGVIVRAAMRALIARGSFDAPPAAAPAATRPRRGMLSRLRFDAGYLLALIDEGGVSHGAVFEGSVEVGFGFSVALAYRYVPPLVGRGSKARTDVALYPASLGSWWSHAFFADRMEIGLGLQLVMSIMSPRTDPLVPNLDADDSALVVWGVAPLARVSLNLGWRWRLFLRAGVNIPLNPKRFIASGIGWSEVLLAPSRVQPELAVGIAL